MLRTLLGVALAVAAADPELEKLVEARAATIVLAPLDGSRLFVGNPQRATQRFLPASTFKIPNTLIALERGVIRADDVVPWDGRDRGLAEWNRDQTLASAFSTSCVWFYQELARRVGLQAYRETLATIGYGNADPGSDVTTFWLEGELRISALEQIAFLRSVVRRTLPFSPASYDALDRVMVVERTPEYTLRAKTGWAARVSPQVGWYVGWVEKGGATWLFAVNLEITSSGQLGLRRELALEALRAKGILAGGEAR